MRLFKIVKRNNKLGFGMVEALMTIPLVAMIIYISLNASSMNVDFSRRVKYSEAMHLFKNELQTFLMQGSNCKNFLQQNNIDSRMGIYKFQEFQKNKIMGIDDEPSMFASLRFSIFDEANAWVPPPPSPPPPPVTVSGAIVPYSGKETAESFFLATKKSPIPITNLNVIQNIRNKYLSENNLLVTQMIIYGSEFNDNLGPSYMGYNQSMYRGILEVKFNYLSQEKGIVDRPQYLKIPLIFLTDSSNNFNNCTSNILEMKYMVEYCNSLGGNFGIAAGATKSTCLVPKRAGCNNRDGSCIQSQVAKSNLGAYNYIPLRNLKTSLF